MSDIGGDYSLGWNGVSKVLFKDHELYEKYLCLICHFLLRSAVQAANCGHWYCEGCISRLLKTTKNPVCPSCNESLKSEDDDDADAELYYPDKFVRRDIDALEMVCLYHASGCEWEGTFGKLAGHLEGCEYSICKDCNERLSINPTEHNCKKLLALSNATPNTPFTCPICKINTLTSQAHLEDHLTTQHIRLNNTPLALRFASLETTLREIQNVQNAQTGAALRARTSAVTAERVEADGRDHPYDSGFGTFKGSMAERDNAGGVMRKSATGVLGGVGELGGGAMMTAGRQGAMQEEAVSKLRYDVMNLQRELKDKNDEILSLRATVNKLEKVQRSKTADFEDRDFRLSLIENSNHDGSMVWKIPQFSQRMDDAKSGKYTSIFSLPFYTGRYGYKMCLRLYILGDGIGKGSYMSLFFVLMKGEFDNILQWPFTHKVTFKLINQNGGRDVVDTFQPDPMSSSFRKPKSDMNIASGCPRFIPHAELKNGFTVDDTVFIKCIVDTTTIKHP